MNSSKELEFERDDKEGIEAQTCNFDLSGKLILYWKIQGDKNNSVRIYSIQTEAESKCENTYNLPKEKEVISISNDSKVWLRSNDQIQEMNLNTGKTMVISTIRKKVISESFSKRLDC